MRTLSIFLYLVRFLVPVWAQSYGSNTASYTAAQIASAACTPLDAFTPIDFTHAQLVRSHLGGQGGPCDSGQNPELCTDGVRTGSTPQELYFSNVGTTPTGDCLDLRITSESTCARASPEYRCTACPTKHTLPRHATSWAHGASDRSHTSTFRMLVMLALTSSAVVNLTSKRFRRISRRIQSSMGNITQFLGEAIEGNQAVNSNGLY